MVVAAAPVSVACRILICLFRQLDIVSKTRHKEQQQLL